ncbi:protein kinase [Glaciimonas sp. GS1]|uniref:Protein kinase n=2 Tax=Glaciimonas soli TaxID=2590999 RepID=A0A843YT25_9BURK|nr:protein kinase [Glaciimonas soli]
MPIKPGLSLVTSDEVELSEENCLQKGTRLADFKILGVIGEGGFGIVYFAFDKSLRRMVAIKEYMPGAFAGRGVNQKVTVRSSRHQETFALGLKSFINEARLLAQFDHPALIKVYRFWEQNNTGYMAMRYYDGRTLRSVVKNTPEVVTEIWLKNMLKPMLEALDAMYRVNILHRDISPDNIMIQKSGEAVLLDFGAARQLIGDMTHSLTVILKPGYAPIEQYADDVSMKQGPWTDIYSLCAVVYFAITNTAPPTSVARMIKDPIVPLAQVPEFRERGFSMGFLSAIDLGLSVNPEDRPQSIEEFRRLLSLQLLVAIPTPRRSTGSADSGTRKHRKQTKKWWHTVLPRLDQTLSFKHAMTLLVALMIGVICTFGYFLFDSSATAPTVATAIPTTIEAATKATAAAVSPASVTPVAAPTATVRAPDLGTASNAQAVIEKSPDLSDKSHQDTEVLAALPESETVSPAAVKEPPHTTDIITLSIKPWGTVTVDGNMRGVSPPLKKLVLSEGKHQIKISNPQFASRTINITSDKKKMQHIDVDFSSTK